MAIDKNGHGVEMEVAEDRRGLATLCSSLVEMTEQVLHTDPEKSQRAHPSLWAEGPIGRTFQQPPFYWPHRIIQGYQALQLLRAQETGEGPQPEEGMKLTFMWSLRPVLRQRPHEYME